MIEDFDLITGPGRRLPRVSETYVNEGEKNKLSMIETHLFLGIIE